MTQNPTIRLAQPGEEPAIHEAHMRSIREVCVRDHGEEEIKGWGHRPLGDRWTKQINLGEAWVVTLDNYIFGVGSIEMLGNKRAQMLALYLTPEVIGKGAGKALALTMIKEAKKKGANSITLESTLTAHDFYKSLGFKDTGPILNHEIGGHPVRCLPMALDIQSFSQTPKRL